MKTEDEIRKKLHLYESMVHLPGDDPHGAIRYQAKVDTLKWVLQ